DKIVKIGTINNTSGAKKVINAGGKAVTPGFINMLSWGAGSLLNDGRSMSGIKQGVTLELFGEGSSVGPLSEAMQRNRWGENPDDYLWKSFGEGLEYLEN
ncbi:MAG: D-aminoacylase, partial [Chromatocurvus sp.]